MVGCSGVSPLGLNNNNNNNNYYSTEGTLKIIKKVGKGAFGDVFHGVYKKKDVAVKQILLGTSKAAEILQGLNFIYFPFSPIPPFFPLLLIPLSLRISKRTSTWIDVKSSKCR